MQRKRGNNSRNERLTDYLNVTASGIAKLRDQSEEILKILDLLVSSKNKHIYTIGNGGSSSAASHMVDDLLIWGKLNISCLSDNTPTITALANDYSYEDIFSNQLMVLGKEGDILIVFSGSGNSQNILNAIEVAVDKKMKIIAVIGTDGGRVVKEYNENLTHLIHIQVAMSNYEDASVVFIHLLMELLKN